MEPDRDAHDVIMGDPTTDDADHDGEDFEVEADCKLIEIPSGLGSLDTKKKMVKKTNFFVSKITTIYSDLEIGGRDSGYMMDVTLVDGRRNTR